MVTIEVRHNNVDDAIKRLRKKVRGEKIYTTLAAKALGMSPRRYREYRNGHALIPPSKAGWIIAKTQQVTNQAA